MMMNMALPTFLVALSLASSSASSSSNATTTLQVCIDDTDCSREDTRCFEVTTSNVHCPTCQLCFCYAFN